MSFDSLLIHLCTIQRATITVDAYNNNVETYADLYTNVRCRLVTKQQILRESERVEGAITTTYTLFVHADTDIASDDRITNLVYEDGTQDATSIFQVQSVVPHHGMAAHHKTIGLEVVS